MCPRAVIVAAAVGLVSFDAAAQSIAEVQLRATENGFGPDGVNYTIEVYVEALQNQIGNQTGINGFNLRFDVFGGEITSITPTSELFGQLNVDEDDAGFDVSGQANSFVGNNFSIGVPILTLQGVFDTPFDLLVNTQSGIFTSQGDISLFNALTGLPGAFQPSVGYDEVIFGSLGVPTPGAIAPLVASGVFVARRRRPSR